MVTIASKSVSEHLEQARVVSWFRQTYPDTLIFAVPNGGLRSKSQALKLKVEGVVPGVPDLFIPAWRVWVEMKRVKGGVLSKEQQNMIKYLQSVNYCVIVGHGAEDAINQLRNQHEIMQKLQALQ
jgi:VRR-NUC domain